ncbi:MAG: hypothetical protein CL862_04845 [Cyanobium sp. NAT70]|nr:hypothetical protein [Cyanobium sp. NAT70]|tara:strand:- start:317 stop:535 length:219 start_codon:yes stop_codon:yes gene_type:complete
MNSFPGFTNPDPKRLYGMLFFLAGGAFHCLTFLGTEWTIEWTMGMFFLAMLLLSVLYWLNYAKKKKVWMMFF